MNNRASAATVALALGFIAVPSIAAAQQYPAIEAAEALALAKPSLARDTAPGPKADASRPNAEAPGAVADPVALSSAAVADLTNWVIASGDNNDLPFIVIDKLAAEVFAFDARGRLLAATPALLGITPGDESSPGVGDRELSEISPEERTTPAGRFVAKFGTASGHRKVLWVDYATAISLHPVVIGNKKERRLQRLKSPSAEDNRITYGCINVPPSFYAKIVRPLFKKSTGLVYILPETKPLNQVFLAFRNVGQPGLASVSYYATRGGAPSPNEIRNDLVE